ncbi:MAG: CAP domain-containing protein [Flavobacteriales bacterium]
MNKLLILLMIFSGAVFGQSDSLFFYYKTLNDTEERLLEYRDSDNDLKLKIQQLALVNASRQKYKAPPVQLDILASRAANKMCKEAALNNFTGHYNMAGEKPYHRYAFAGGKDHVSENASGYWNSGGINTSNANILSLMKEMHASFMDERAPNDGHKQNCIEAIHNYVGLGFYAQGIQFRYYEEFIDRYYTFVSVPDTVKARKEFTIKLKPQEGKYFYCLFAYYEKPLKPITPAAIQRQGSYTDYGSQMPISLWPEDMAKLRKGDTYEISLKFTKPGVYYLHIYQDSKEHVKAPRRSSSKGKLQASGVVIVVQ